MIVREYFTNREICCRCGCGLMPALSSVERLYAVRILYEATLNITSGARCPENNVRCLGTPGSIHLPQSMRRGISATWSGAAFDISIIGIDEQRLMEIAIYAGFRGFGHGKTFLHIDDANRPEITIWQY